MRRFPWVEALFIFAILAIHLRAAWVMPDAAFSQRWFTRDDAYYYFKIAQNISEGRGSTFDGINPTNGYHPLWLLLCIPIFSLARIDLVLPLRVLLVALGGLNAATTVLLYRLGRSLFGVPLGLILATWWAFDWTVYATVYQMGLETALVAFTFTWLLYQLHLLEEKAAYSPKDVLVLAVLASLVLLSRLDMVFVVLMLGLWITFRGSAARYWLPLDILFVWVGIMLAFLLRLGFSRYYSYTEAATVAVALGLVFPLAYFLGGLDAHPDGFSEPDWWRRYFLVSFLAAVLFVGSELALQALGVLEALPRSALLLAAVFIPALALLGRSLGFLLRGKRTPRTFGAEWSAFASRWLRQALLFYGIVGGVLVVYMLVNYWQFGTFSPISGQVKRWWGTFDERVYGGRARSGLEFFNLDPSSDFNAWAPLTSWLGWLLPSDLPTRVMRPAFLMTLIALGVLFFAIWLARRRELGYFFARLAFPALLSGLNLQSLSYNLTGYAALKEWYWAGQMLFVILMLALTFFLLLRPLLRRRAVQLLFLTFALGFSLTSLRDFVKTVRTLSERPVSDQALMGVLPLLEAHTEEGAQIGMTGGGNVGYFLRDRTIVNMDGLVNSPEYFRALRERRALEYLLGRGLRYLLVNPQIVQAPPYFWMLDDQHWKPIAQYGGKLLLKYQP